MQRLPVISKLLALFLQVLGNARPHLPELGMFQAHAFACQVSVEETRFSLPDPFFQQVTEAWVFKAHLVLGLTIFLLFPFTRLVHAWSVPIQYLGRRGYQIVRKRA